MQSFNIVRYISIKSIVQLYYYFNDQCIAFFVLFKLALISLHKTGDTQPINLRKVFQQVSMLMC